MDVEQIRKQAIEEFNQEMFRAEVEKYKKKLFEKRKKSFLHRIFPWTITITITKEI